MKAVIALLLLGTLQASMALQRSQRYVISGKLTCGAEKVDTAATAVRVLDKNTFTDTLIGQGHIAEDGSFKIDGWASDSSSITPELHIYTFCDHDKKCARKLKFELPKKFINDEKGLDFGTFNLETRLTNEETTCKHTKG